jgi:hypothetical protein
MKKTTQHFLSAFLVAVASISSAYGALTDADVA